jgi:hypothetical protein
MAHVVDDQVSVEDLIEKIQARCPPCALQLTSRQEFEELVQSADVVSFNKLG